MGWSWLLSALSFLQTSGLRPVPRCGQAGLDEEVASAS